jgi:cell division protein FtsL
MDDPQRRREMKTFGVVLTLLCLLVLSYAWQHFKAVEYGYKISELKVQRDNLTEMNRALRLEEASLRDPERIDKLAKNMGMISPQPGQVIRMDTSLPESGAPVMASVAPISVISAR